MGGVYRARRRGRLRGRVARLVGVGPEPRSLSVLALVAVAAARVEQRVLPEPGGRPADGGGAAGARRGAPPRDLPPPPPDLPRRRAGDLRRDLVAEVRFCQASAGLVTSPLGLFGIWPGPLGWWAAVPGEAGDPRRRALDPLRRPPAAPRDPDARRDRRARVPAASSRAGKPGFRSRRRIRPPGLAARRGGDAPGLRARPSAARAVREVDRPRRTARLRRVLRGSPARPRADR